MLLGERPVGASSGFGLVLAFYYREPAYALGLATLSAYVKRSIRDARVHLVPISQYDDPVSVAARIRDLVPDLIGISSMSPTWLPLDPHLSAIKRLLPEVRILVGGYQAIVSPDETIAHAAVDHVCVGDGEEPMLGLIRRIRGEIDADEPIRGLWDKHGDGSIVRTPPWLVQDLTAFPFPDYTIFERDGDLGYLSPHAVESKRLTTLPILSGRGCPYRCTYCANTTLLDLYGVRGGFLRKYQPEPLIDELVRLRARYRIEFFQFWDEEFLYDTRYVHRFLDAYRTAIALPFSMFTRPENMTDELCRLAAAAGCHTMWFGVESGSPAYRRQYLNRRISNERMLDAATTARRHGIKMMALNMVGLPFESRGIAAETLDFVRALDPELAIFSQYVALPGTPLYEVCRRHDLLLPPSVEHQMWPIGRLNIREHVGGMTSDEMREAGEMIMRYLETCSRFDP